MAEPLISICSPDILDRCNFVTFLENEVFTIKKVGKRPIKVKMLVPKILP